MDNGVLETILLKQEIRVMFQTGGLIFFLDLNSFVFGYNQYFKK